MSAVDIAAIFAAITSVLTGFLVGLRFLVKGWLNELRPNGGASIKDQVTRLEQRVDQLFVILSKDN